MTDAVDHLKIMNNALARIGGGQIMAEDEDSELAAKVVAMYYDRLEAVLAIHDWGFAAKTYKLDALAPTPDNGYDVSAQKFITGWRFAFALPGTRIGDPRKVLTDPRNPRAPLREFMIEAGTLYCERDTVFAVVTVRADPAIWPPLFRMAVTTSVAADLCVPVTHDDGLARSLRVVAEGTPEEQARGGLLGRAIGDDAARAQRLSPQWRDPLTDARLR